MKRFLNGDAAAELLEKHGMSVLRWKSVGHDALLRTAWELGYPLVVKRVCEDGGSVLQVVNSENEMRAVLATLSFKSREDGGSIYVQRKPEGKEVAVGFVRNEGYAPAVSLGLGGIFSSIVTSSRRLKSGASCFRDELLSASERDSHLHRRKFG